MAVQWGSIYADCVDLLLEGNPGLTLNLLTDEQFYSIAAEVLIDFCSKTGVAKKLFAEQAHFGVQEYPESFMLGDLQGMMVAQTFIYESSDFYLSNADRNWEDPYNIRQPESYRQDSIQTKHVQISPAPQVEGNDITIVAGGSGYGVIGAVDSYTDFTFTCDPSTPQGYGVIAGANGNPYLEGLNPGWGVVGAMVPSTGNLTMQGTALPFNIDNIGPQTFVELIPDSLTPYLKYGILQRVFSGDNELRDEQKSAYCSARYSEGQKLIAAIMCDVYQED